mgnify:CR=1 FL=1
MGEKPDTLLLLVVWHEGQTLGNLLFYEIFDHIGVIDINIAYCGIPSTTTTNSPFGVQVEKCSISSARVPRNVSENFFDISRQTAALRSAPSDSASCDSVFDIRYGDSYNTIVRCSSFSASSRCCRPLRCGRNPSKQNRSQGSADSTRAGTKAVGPGRHSTSTPRSEEHTSELQSQY